MDIKNALLQCLTEKHLGLSKLKIEKILDDELEKPEEEIDCEVIEMCIEMLAEIDHIKLPDVTDIPPAPPLVRPVKKKETLWEIVSNHFEKYLLWINSHK